MGVGKARAVNEFSGFECTIIHDYPGSWFAKFQHSKHDANAFAILVLPGKILLETQETAFLLAGEFSKISKCSDPIEMTGYCLAASTCGACDIDEEEFHAELHGLWQSHCYASGRSFDQDEIEEMSDEFLKSDQPIEYACNFESEGRKPFESMTDSRSPKPTKEFEFACSAIAWAIANHWPGNQRVAIPEGM